MTTHSNPLDDTEVSRPRRRTLLWALAVLVLVGVIWGPGMWYGARWIYWQNRCAEYAASGDEVVYEANLTKAAPLIASKSYLPMNLEGDWSLRNGPRPAGKRVECVDRYRYILFQPPGEWLACVSPEPTIFSHSRRSKGGSLRLVIVSVREGADDVTLYVQPQEMLGAWRVLFPPSPPRLVGSLGTDRGIALARAGTSSQLRLKQSRQRDLRLYAGQVDSENNSHFTIVFYRDGERGIIDGYLADDGRIEMEVRDSGGLPEAQPR